MNQRQLVQFYDLDGRHIVDGQLALHNELELEALTTALPRVSIGDEVQVLLKQSNYEQVFTGTVLNVSRTKLSIHNLVEKMATIQMQEVVDRRRMFKIRTEIQSIATYVLNPDGTEFMADQKVSFYILDISIGGIGIASEMSMESGMLIGFTFTGGIKPVDLDVKILRKTKDEENHIFVYGCQFLDIGRAEADIVNGYIFRRQIDLRNKGK